MRTKVLIITTLNSSGTVVFVATMIAVILEPYHTPESNLTHMKNIKLDSFLGFFSDCCASIVFDAKRLEIDGVLKPNNLVDNLRILE